MMKLGLMMILVIGLTACAHPPVVDVVKPADADRTCALLTNEIVELKRAIVDAKKEAGLSGRNILRAIVFWPSIFGTGVNVTEAINAANARIVHLEHLKQSKQCAS